MVKYPSGLLLVLVLCALLVPFPAEAKVDPLEWAEVAQPGLTGNIVVRSSEVSEIAVGRRGTIYALDSSENSSVVYQSLSAGATWKDINSRLVEAGAELPASKIAIAPDTPGTVAVVTNSGTEVYLSNDGGVTWTDTNVPSLAGAIQAIAISRQYTEAEKSLRDIAIGTAAWGDNTTTGQVWVLQSGKLVSSWQNQSLLVDPSHVGGEVSAIAYSPGYQRDNTIIVVASTATGTDVTDYYRNKTWLCLGKRDTTAGTTSWDAFSGYPVEIATVSSLSAGDAPGVSRISSSLALPSNYSGREEDSRLLFVSYDRYPEDANDDVYRFSDNMSYRLNANDGAIIDISSIAYYGTITSGKLLIGDVSHVAGSMAVQVRRTSNPFDSPPIWNRAIVPPTGPGNAKVSWSSEGDLAFCGTSQSPGGDLDESAFSMSSDDGDNWQQLSLMDITLRLSDVVPAPDSETMFVTTYSTSGPEGIWRSASGTQLGLGVYWSRQLTMDTTSDRIVLRLSPDYASDSTIYAAEVGGNLIAVSHSRGNFWRWRYALGAMIDIVVEDEETIYTALSGGYIRKSTNNVWSWMEPVYTRLPDINMLAIPEKGHILVGGRSGDVAYSTDGGASFTRIPEVIGSGTGDVQVVADANYKENGIIYAATNLSDEGIWRWTIGLSTSWEQIDESITTLETGQCIGGLAMSSEGTLYALRMEQVTSSSGGMTRSLNPSNPYLTGVEFDSINYALPEGTTCNSSTVFSNTLPYLKLSGDSGQNELWTIDTANQIIYRFRDTLCKVSPTLDMPEAGAIIPISPSSGVAYLNVSWKQLSPRVTKYEAGIYLDSAATQRVWARTSTTTSIIAAGGANPAQLTSGTTYYWRVRSIEPIKSPWSETRSFAPALGSTQWSPLAALTRVTPSPGAADVPIRPVFTWNSAYGATGYEFVLARDSEFTNLIVAMTGADALPTTNWEYDKNLDYSTTYFWKVRAISTNSYSEWGTSVFTTRVAPTAQPPPQPPPPSSQSSTPPPQPAPSPPSPPEPTPLIPPYLLWMAIGIGVTLAVALVVLIVRTRS